MTRIALLLPVLLAALGCVTDTLTCDAPKTNCDDRCYDLTTDARSCGWCGRACDEGLSCRDGECVVIDLPNAVYATCQNTGELVTLGADLVVQNSAVLSVGPQSMAMDGGDLLLVDTIASTLTTFNAATIPPTPRPGGDLLGQAPNQALLHGGRLYVINSMDNNVQVIDLSKPRPAPLANSRTVDQVLTAVGSPASADGTNPYFGVFIGDILYVTLLGSFAGSPVLGNRLLEIDFSTTPADPGRELFFDAKDLKREGQASVAARPSGIAASGTRLFVALGNLDIATWSAAGPGYLAVVETSGAMLTQEALIELPAPCQNAGAVLVDNGRVYVSCIGDYAGGGAAVITLDAATLEILTTTPLVGAPGRILRAGNRILVADMSAGRLFPLELDGTLPADRAEGVHLCEPQCWSPTSCFQLTSDLAVKP